MSLTFLIDANLPIGLARFVEAQGVRAAHVSELGLQEAGDIELQRIAGERHDVVITKDADFALLVSTRSQQQAVVWLRLGNCRNPELMRRFGLAFKDILTALEAGEQLIEVR